MRKYALTALIVLTLTALMCSCSKDESNHESLDVQPISTVDPAKYAQEGSLASGTRVEQQLDKLKEDNESDSASSEETTAKPNTGKVPSKLTQAGGESGQNTGNNKDGNNDKNNGTAQPAPTMQMAMLGEYASALTEEELKETKKVAYDYARKKYSKEIKMSDLKVASDDNKGYTKFPLYNRGNIIVYTCKVEEKTKSIIVGRLNPKKSWTVLQENKK